MLNETKYEKRKRKQRIGGVIWIKKKRSFSSFDGINVVMKKNRDCKSY